MHHSFNSQAHEGNQECSKTSIHESREGQSLPGTIMNETSDKDMKAIYTHPLFPLMALLFEKCEQATQSPDPPTSDSFDVDIEEFVNRQKREGKNFFIDNAEIDNLMIKAIQVLRIHLLELEKVNELCKDFCHRYITCLKGKMHSENLLKEERSSSDSMSDSGMQSPDQTSLGHSGSAAMEGQFQQAQYQTAVVNSSGHVVYTPVIPQGVVTPQGIVAQTIPGTVQLQPAVSNAHNQMVIHGSTPLSQIGISQQLSTSNPSGMSLAQTMSVMGNDAAEVNDLLNKRKPKRGVLPKHATNIMRSWLFQHIVHPYPTEDEKRMIAAQTNLTLLQVNNWFINARRRILQPMLDASNPEASKAKKQKTQNRPSTQRFWPQSLANLGHSTTITSSTAGSIKSERLHDPNRSDQPSPELPQLQPPRNPLSPSSVLNQSSHSPPLLNSSHGQGPQDGREHDDDDDDDDMDDLSDLDMEEPIDSRQ